MTIKLLKNRYIAVGGRLNRCADGCCSWRDYETELHLAGEEINEEKISILDMSEMKEGEDYIHIS